MILNSELKPVFSMYCVDFAARFGEHSDDVLREYAKQLILNKIGRTSLQRGIQRLVKRAAENKFTPNPTEFVELCKPTAEDLGLPGLEEAYRDIDRGLRRSTNAKPYRFKHRMIELIARDIGQYAFRLANEEKRQAMLHKSFEKWLDVARTEGLPPKRPQIAEPEPRPEYEKYMHKVSPAEGEFAKRIERIRNNLAEKNKNKNKGLHHA